MKEKFRLMIAKLKGIKKPYYILFVLLLIFFIYNTITLRGFFYAENDPGVFFGFMDKWNGHTTAFNRSYSGFRGERSYVPAPEDIHDIENADEWYGSIFGTVVFMKWKWVGLHFGDHMILIDTWVPDGYDIANNHFFGHPYYILSRYDKVDNYSPEDKRGERVLKKWEQQFGELSQWEEKKAEQDSPSQAVIAKYRRATLVFYAVLMVAFVVLVLYIVRRLQHRKFFEKPLTVGSLKEGVAGFITGLKGMKKRYYVILLLLLVFFAYNMLTLRGNYRVLNYHEAEFVFKGKQQCSSNIAGWSYDMITEKKYTAEPYIASGEEEHYHAVLGTVIFVERKWLGLHVGNHMILLNTHMPKGFAGKNNIFGRMYIVLHS